MVIRHLMIAAFLLILSSHSYALSSIQASVDRNPVTQGEYFVLNIVADDEIDAANLDTSVLLKDFIVGRTSVSRSTQMINFKTSKETRWQILLAPKNKGQITIPSLRIDKIGSNPIPLKVVDATAIPEKMKNLFIEAELSSQEAYVGQMLIYTVRLFLAAELQRGAINAPVLEGAKIKQIGDDKDFDQLVDGRRFRVIERTYAITPSFPGELTIAGASFAGDILINAPGRQGLFTFNESRPMHARAQKHVVLVNSLPAHLQGTALVADLVVLKESWPQEDANKTTEYQVGSPITREITLIASNADESQLPEIEQNLPQGLKTYPEKPQRKSIVRDQRLVSQLVQTTAIVPTTAGSFTLPEIIVPWWNPHLKKQDFAKIPARTVQVVAPVLLQATNLPPAQTSEPRAGFWPWLSGFLALCWLLTLGMLYQARTKQLTQISVENLSNQGHPQGTKANTAQALNALQIAAQDKNASQTLKALLHYYQTASNKELTLIQLSQQQPKLSDTISQLQAIAYGGKKQTYDYDALISLVKSLPLNDKPEEKVTLDALNPS
ncbi:BatD family protein [Shewanella gelidii]|uniref:DUF7939 domain-containing protein n=1 Tax=Shewanella gelidii TaxID=1642821 RepID=A0A917JT52_9GAMM|nr:BatD family protein [Shewanella gelidii]MCL1098217.1 BatD family protein [Shewanella gelidii]GGI83474.1 hypothetical protein GCM10009332_20960 [Shewanella gelidii]